LLGDVPFGATSPTIVIASPHGFYNLSTGPFIPALHISSFSLISIWRRAIR